MSNKNVLKKFPGMAKQPQQPFNVADAVPANCKGCGGYLFDPAVRLGVVSKLSLSNKTGQDVLVKFETYVCKGCGLEYGKDRAREEDGQS